MAEIIVWCGAVFLSSPLLSAQNQNPEPVDSADLWNILLDETTVTAAKPLRKVTAPVPVFTVDEQNITRTGITDIADALHRLPGVNLRDYGGAGGLKTVSVRGLGASHTVVAYDGLPLSDAQTGAIDLSRYSTDQAGNLSLIIGDNNDLFLPVRLASAPATLTLATPAMAPDRKIALTTRLKFGSFGYVSPYVNLTGKSSQSVTLNMTGEFVHAKNNYPFKWQNGNTMTTERRENNRVNSGHVEGNIQWEGKHDNHFKAKIYYYNNSRQLPGPVLYYNINGSQEYLKERNSFFQMTYRHPFNSKWSMFVAGKFNWAASLYTDFGSRQSGNYVNENYFQREYYTTFNLLFTLNRNWAFDYSADYIYNALNSNLTYDSRPYRNSLLQSLSAKMSYGRFTLNGRLIGSVFLNGAKNPESAVTKNQSKLSPALSLSVRLLPDELFFARVSYKNIFRMPTFNEAYFNHYGSPDLKPESTEQWDLGLSYQLPYVHALPLLSLTADVYRNRVRDRIVAVPYNMFVWTVTNVSSVVATGADVTLNCTVNLGRRQSLLASGTWSYQRARIDVKDDDIIYGKQVAYTPLNSGSFSLSYENPWVNLVLHGQGASARYTDNSNYYETRIPGYFEFGATLWRELNIGSNKFELRFDLLNFLNKQYYVVARYPMPGRSWQFSIKYTL